MYVALATATSTLLCWLALLLVFGGIGLLVRRGFGLSTTTPEAAFTGFWSGWALTLAALQLWHFFFRISWWTFFAALAAALAGLLWNRADAGRLVQDLLARRRLFVALLLLAGLWLAAVATGPVRNYDTGLYTLQDVKWLTAHPVVPGLGNLHGRLAFNSSFLLYAAMVEAAPWTARAYVLAAGVPLLALLAHVLLSCLELFTQDRSRPGLFLGLLAGTLLTQVLGKDFPGLSTDLPAFILNVVIAHQLLGLILAEREGRERDFSVFLIATLATLGVTVKLSQAAFCATALLIAFALWSKRRPVLLAAGCCAIFLPWVGRQVMLSGYLAFPGGYGATGVEWQVPRPLALDIARWVAGWARQPGVHWQTVTGNWDWLGPWLDRLPATVTRPAALAVVALLYAVWRRRWGRPWLFLVPAVASIAFCFAIAPDPRFAGASLAILAAGAAALVVPTAELPRLAVLWAAFNVLTTVLPQRRPVDYRALPDVGYETRVTDSGLRVHLPEEGNQCWDAPLPCTPYFRPNLRPRGAGPGDGFVLDDDFTFANIHDTVPRGFTVSADLGVALVSGWRDFDEARGRRIAVDAGRLLVYTERDMEATLRLEFCGFEVGREALEKATLEISFGQTTIFGSEVGPQAVLELPLRLRRGFNPLAVEASEGRRRRGDGLRFLKLALCAVEIRSEQKPLG